MPYFIGEYIYDKPAEARAAARGSHREYLQGLVDAGKVVLAGPMADDANGYVVYQCQSIAEAEQLLREDPYQTLGGASSAGPREWTISLRASFIPEP
ncbi:MAG: YciI family protein [Antricoccus sp.]